MERDGKDSVNFKSSDLLSTIRRTPKDPKRTTKSSLKSPSGWSTSHRDNDKATSKMQSESYLTENSWHVVSPAHDWDMAS